jgi:hypothetical protein
VRRSQLRRSAGAARLQARGPRATAIAAVALLCALLVASCGGASQDANEPRNTYTVAVSKASFPSKQAIAKPITLRIAVRNDSSRTLPNVAVTVNSLTYRATKPANLADHERPTWIIYDGPGQAKTPPVESEVVTREGGGRTASLHTWALGRLSPGATKVFAWRLLPVVSGTRVIRYAIAAGLNGKAKARLAGGGLAVGSLTVHIAPAPRTTHVNPETGQIAQGPYTVSPGPVGAVP